MDGGSLGSAEKHAQLRQSSRHGARGGLGQAKAEGLPEAVGGTEKRCPRRGAS